jgi:hypothetical protein
VTMPDGMTQIAWLGALAEIETLKALRDEAVDRQDWETYEALHAPDHRSENEDYPPTLTAHEMVANLRKIMAGLKTAHHSHTPLITFDNADRARGIWAMKGVSRWTQSDGEHWFEAFGHYHETYERRDGRWRFTSRALRYIHTRRSPGAIFPPPLETRS